MKDPVTDLELLSAVALTEDLPGRGLRRGQVGTVVEELTCDIDDEKFIDGSCLMSRAESDLEVSAIGTSCSHSRRKAPRGGYLATSDDVQGLIAQGRTVTETLEIARDVARRLIEAQHERRAGPWLAHIEEAFDYPLIVGE